MNIQKLKEDIKNTNDFIPDGIMTKMEIFIAYL